MTETTKTMEKTSCHSPIIYASSSRYNEIWLREKKRIYTIILAMMLCASVANAQNVIVGMTSNGGPAGRGTVFSMKTDGSNFSIIQPFADWGKNPNGDLIQDADGNFYGMTSTGGTFGFGGTVFKMTTNGDITILRQFSGTATDGSYPQGELIKGADGAFYGLTRNGGSTSYGTIFKITSDGTYTLLKTFNIATDGSNPNGHLVLAKDGNFYGITYGGGTNGAGTIFKYTPSGAFSVLHHMNKTTDGGNCYGSLTEGKDGNLYGMTYSGGQYNYGTIFQISKGGDFKVLRHMNVADGTYTQGDLIQASDGNFYGMCYGGGTFSNGTIFRISAAGKFSVLKNFSSPKDGGFPYGNLMQNKDGFLYGMTRTGGTGSSGTIFKISTGGDYSVIHSLVGATEGGTPNGSLIRGKDGNLYGMTSVGGPNGWGTAFRVTSAGLLTVLAAFNGATEGNVPFESLVKGKDSAYYGTTSTGGQYNYGTIFKICGGATTILHSFNRSAEGGTPKGSLMQASDGSFYGLTSEGGLNNYGTIYKITSSGNYSVLHHFAAGEGSGPQGSLIQATDGKLYGMTSSGGANSGGSIFRIGLDGSFKVLHSFTSATEGANPEGNLIQAADGNFYGMTANNARIFKMDATGLFTVLHTFVVNTEGNYPLGSLLQAKDGNFYGFTSSGGTYGYGTIFKMDAANKVTILKQLNPTTDGKTPKGNLIQGYDGNLYGMTSAGGTNNAGTIFKITTGGNFSVLRQLDLIADGGAPFGSFILAPVNNLVANPQSITLAEDTKKTITLTGSGGSSLTFRIGSQPQHGTVTGGTAASRTYTPAANYSGNDQFSFRVNNGCISSLPAVVSITITPVADTPVLAKIGNKTVVQNTALKFTAKATDGDAGQILKFSLINAPTGATINATSGAFSWTPAVTGSFTFKVRVTDNGSPALYDEEQITVTVTNAFALNAVEENAGLSLNASMYPNPVDSRFYVTLPNTDSRVTIRIVDLNGSIITTRDYNVSLKQPLQVDASTLKPGVYLLQLQSGELKQTLKFIKK